MTNSPLVLLCDTNVWLDAFLPSRPRNATVRKLLSTAVAQGHTLAYATHTAADVFYAINREAKEWIRAGKGELTQEWARAARSQAWSCVKDMHEVAVAVGTDEPDMWKALRYRAFNEDLEDNLILVTAERAQANYLITSDGKLRGKSTVAALSPEDMLALLELSDD